MCVVNLTMKVAFAQTVTKEINVKDIYDYVKKDLETNGKPATNEDIREAYAVNDADYIGKMYGFEVEDNLLNESALEVIFDEFDNFLKNC